MLVVDLGTNAVSMRRRVDWPVILGTNPPAPSMLDQPAQAELASLLSAFDELLTLDDTDKILRRAVELARERIGFSRAGLFLLDETRNVMLGTWGTDLDGNLVDERHVMYDLGETNRKVFRRGRRQPFHHHRKLAPSSSNCRTRLASSAAVWGS